MFKIRIALLTSLSLIGSVSVSASTHTIERQDGSSLTYYLTKSSPNQTDTLLVIMQGSDCNSVAHSSSIKDEFSQVIPGADLLTVEKYGLSQEISWNPNGDSPDCPAVYVEKDSPSQRAADYQQVLESLDSQYEDIVVLGGSEGALVAAMVASQVSSVDTLVSLNSGGRFFVDDVLFNMEKTMPPEAFTEAKNGFLGFQQAVVNADFMDINMSGHGFAWWKDMFTLDQTNILSGVSAETFILQSELDINVSPELAAKQAEKLMQSRSNVLFSKLNGLDHSFKDPQGESQKQAVIEQIRELLD